MEDVGLVVLGSILSLMGGVMVAVWNFRHQNHEKESLALHQMFFKLNILLEIAEARERDLAPPRTSNEELDALREIAQIAQLSLNSSRTREIALRAIGLIANAPAAEIEDLLSMVRGRLNPGVTHALFKAKYVRRAYLHSDPEDHA